jgi:Aspartyl protease
VPTLSFPYVDDVYVEAITSLVTHIFRPLIPLRLGYGGTVSPNATDCLVDSGADYNLFPGWWAEEVGIPVAQGPAIELGGIGGNVVRAYRHAATLLVGQRTISTTADFSYDHDLPLLGRDGFFNHFTEVQFSEIDGLVRLIWA